jgi:hypothetical protein
MRKIDSLHGIVVNAMARGLRPFWLIARQNPEAPQLGYLIRSQSGRSRACGSR